jgi:hypothetical protein
MPPMQPSIIFKYFPFARWYGTPTPLFHLPTHAYLLIKPLLEYTLPYIALDNILVFQHCIQSYI